MIEIIANKVLKLSHIHHSIGLGHGQAITELTNSAGTDTAATQAADSRHTRVIPALNMLLVYQLLKLALAGHSVIEVKAAKLILMRG